MIKVYANNDCGCCYSELQFNSLESAAEAFAKAGFGNGISITDDAGEVHEDLDTFYGFSTDANEQGGKGLGYLAGMLGLLKQQ